MVKFSDFIGKKLEYILFEKSYDQDDCIYFLIDGVWYEQKHHQSCCENVYVETCEYDESMFGEEILESYETSRDAASELGEESATYTFYHMRTHSDNLFIRWLGTSNGYYSESVDVYKSSDQEKLNDLFLKQKINKMVNQ